MKKIVLICVVLGGMGFAIFQSKQSPKTWDEALREELGAPEYESVDRNKPLDEQTAIVEIGGRVFKIPKVYIQSNLSGREKVTGLNLLYVMPDFTSRADFKNKQEYYDARDKGLMAHALIKDPSTYTSIPQIIENRKKSEKMTKYDGNHYGLERWIDFDSPRHPKTHYADTYIEYDSDENVISFVQCDSEMKKGKHGCSHMFVDKGLLYKVYYNKKNFLPTWKAHRQTAIEFIDSFEIEKHNKKGK